MSVYFTIQNAGNALSHSSQSLKASLNLDM